MPGNYRITFALSAVQDLEAVRSWYADQQVPEVGERLIVEIVSAVERLADFPESGRIVPEFGVLTLREIIYPPFRVVYRLGPRQVHVVRVWRNERILRMP